MFHLRDLWHEKKNSPVWKFLAPLAHWINRITSLGSEWRRSIWLLSGSYHGEPLGVFFAGGRKNKSYLANMLFGNEHRERSIGRAYLWTIPCLLRKYKKQSDISIVEVQQKNHNFNKDVFFVPCWTGGMVDLFDKKRLGLNRLRTDKQKIRKYGLSSEISREPEQYKLFYEHMYLPFMKNSHGEKAFCETMEDVNRVMPEAELLLVKRGAEHIGGGIIHYARGLAHLWVMGVAGGKEEHIKMGVCGAVASFAEERIRQKGYQKMHFGGTRPFLRDGVLRFKKERGLALRDAVPRGFAIRMLRNSTAARNFFIHNPFIYRKEAGLAGAVFMNANEIENGSMASICKDYYMEGMTSLDVFVFGEGSPPGLIPPEMTGKVWVRPFHLNGNGGSASNGSGKISVRTGKTEKKEKETV